VVVVLLYLYNSSTDVVPVVILQYMHIILTYVATLPLVLLYCTLLARMWLLWMLEQQL